MIALGLIGTACGGGSRGASEASPERLPPWLAKVEPAPGDTTSSLRVVEVEHRVLGDGESVRLLIDGVDVTQYADLGGERRISGPGRLLYDPERSNNIVPLRPGEHTATVQRVRLPGLGQQTEVLDSFTWSFSIL